MSSPLDEPFYGEDWPTDDPAKRVNATIPGSQGGFIESTKRAIIIALREAITGTTLNHLISGDKISIDLEYPMVPEKYPGIWVQFSFTKFVQAGISHEPLERTVENEGEADQWVNWEPIREFMFEGRVTLTVVALTSLERDRIADAIVTMLAFSRVPESVITRADRDTKQFRQFLGSLSANPYVSMTANLDIVTPGGQAVTPGVPWDPQQLGYEDSYSFDLLGQTNITFLHDGTYTLRAVRLDPHLVVFSPYNWQ